MGRGGGTVAPSTRRVTSPGALQGAFVVLLVVDLVTTSLADQPSEAGAALVAAVALVAVALAASFLLPWSRLPHAALAALPLLDVAALGLTRIGLPGTGSDLLCVIPALWLAREFQLRGALLAGLAVATLMSVPWMLVLGPVKGNVSSALLAPALAVAVGGITAWGLRQVRLRDDEAEDHRRFNEAILDTVDVGLVLLDRDGTYRTMNRRHQDFMRLAFPGGHAGAAGQLGEVFDEEGRRRLQREDMPTIRAMQGEEFDDCRIWVGGDPLTRRALSVSARTVRDGAGRFAGAALAYKDVTDFMRALEVKEEFVASVSHELRTPLTSIKGYVDLLLERDDIPVEAVRHLQVVARGSDRLSALVGDLLQSAQLDAGPVQVVRQPADLARIAQDSVAAALPVARTSRLALRYHGPERLTSVVDQTRMRQVVDNLVSNAIKYSRPGGCVDVRLGVDGRRVVMEVADTGIGIEPADRDRLFTRFFRSRQAQQRGIQGVGLGLSITKTIVEGHGGRIEVESEVAHGTTFRVRMPHEEG